MAYRCKWSRCSAITRSHLSNDSKKGWRLRKAALQHAFNDDLRLLYYCQDIITNYNMFAQREWAKQYGDQKVSEDYKLFESFFIAVSPKTCCCHHPTCHCLIYTFSQTFFMIALLNYWCQIHRCSATYNIHIFSKSYPESLTRYQDTCLS